MYTLEILKFKWNDKKGYQLVSTASVTYKALNDLNEHLIGITYSPFSLVKVNVNYRNDNV